MNAKEYATPEPNPYLVNAIVKSFYYHKQIQAGKTIENLQTEEGLKGLRHLKQLYYGISSLFNFSIVRVTPSAHVYAETDLLCTKDEIICVSGLYFPQGDCSGAKF